MIPVYREHHYDIDFPYFRPPKEIGVFSHNSERQFCHNNSQRKYFSPPREWDGVEFNLDEGIDCFRQKDDSIKEYIDDLLKWVMVNKQKFAVASNNENNVATR